MAKNPEEFNGDPRYEKWLLRIRKDLRKAVEKEAGESQRTPPQQIEFILTERYDMPALTDDDRGRAKELAKRGGSHAVKPRSRKPPKDATGTFGK